MLRLINLIFQLLTLAVLIRIFLSWIPINRFHRFVSFIFKVTNPIIQPFQRLVPPERLGGIDLSPIFAILALSLAESIVLRILSILGSFF